VSLGKEIQRRKGEKERGNDVFSFIPSKREK